MNRPFPVQFETAIGVEMLEIKVHFGTPIDDKVEHGVIEVLTTFGRLGEVGGLAGQSLDPAQSGMSLEFSEVGPEVTRWLFRNVRIDLASVHVLINMIHYIHLEDAPVKAVRIGWQAISGLVEPMAIQFPGQWHRPSFQLDIGDLLDDIDVVVDFVEPQDDMVIERIVEIISVWLLATHRGAYADDSFDPSKSAVFLGPDVMDVSPNRIVWFIEILRCNESALDGLINLLEWVHQRVARIRRVEIGP